MTILRIFKPLTESATWKRDRKAVLPIKVSLWVFFIIQRLARQQSLSEPVPLAVLPWPRVAGFDVATEV
jgi:hypothetical protein